VDAYGIERGDVLLSLQLILTLEEERAVASGRPPVSPPSAVDARPALKAPQHLRPVGAPSRTGAAALAQAVPPPTRPIVMVDLDTGAGTLQALRRDLTLEHERNGHGAGTAVVALGFVGLDQIRLVLGEESVEDVVKGLVEVAPFALSARDRLYRSGRDELLLLISSSEDDDVETARSGLETALCRFLSDRGFPEVRLDARRIDPATLAG
jgi:GGDEF domain-containing protein